MQFVPATMSVIEKAQDWFGVSRQGLAAIVTGFIVVALTCATAFGIARMDYQSRERLFGSLTLAYALFPLLVAILPRMAGRAVWLSSFWVILLAMAYAGDVGPDSHFIGAAFLFLAGIWTAAVGWFVLKVKSRAQVRPLSYVIRLASSTNSGIRRHVRISLMGLLQLSTAVGLLCTLFAVFHVGIALLLTALANAGLAVVSWLMDKGKASVSAQITMVLVLAVVFDTDWGLSSPRPKVYFSWRFFSAACVMQLVTLLLFFATRPNRQS